MSTEIQIKEVLAAAGSGAKLARQLGIATAAVHQWQRVPYKRVLDVERITGISRHRLRPDIYGPENEAAA
jgi:DNA-binding transcriptional regulator YdaS (Cro superfamily)